jgi:phosphinothricin acetyltransferase
MIVRDATSQDVPALAELYGWHVLHGTGTFEESPPAPAEMAARLARTRRAGLPYVVAEVEGKLAAFASASPYSTRTGYRFTAEDSVYVAFDRTGQGFGRAVLSEVIERCAALGLLRLVAFIGDSGNVGSIGLHRALGFEAAGVLRGIGFKHERWLDVVLMQRSLTPAIPSPPDVNQFTAG